MTQPNRDFDKFWDQNDVTLSGNSWQLFDFTRTMDGHQIINDTTVEIQVSYDADSTHMKLAAGESASYDFRRRNKLYLKQTTATSGVDFRVSAWMTG